MGRQLVGRLDGGRKGWEGIQKGMEVERETEKERERGAVSFVRP